MRSDKRKALLTDFPSFNSPLPVAYHTQIVSNIDIKELSMGVDIFRTLPDGGVDLASPVKLRKCSPPKPFRPRDLSPLVAGCIRLTYT